MALSAFDDKSQEPQATDLRNVLGRSGAHWESLIAHIEAEFAHLDVALVVWYLVGLVLIAGAPLSAVWAVGLVLQVVLAVYLAIRFRLG